MHLASATVLAAKLCLICLSSRTSWLGSSSTLSLWGWRLTGIATTSWHWFGIRAGILAACATLYSFYVQFPGMISGWVRVLSGLSGTLLAGFVGIGFWGACNGNNLSVSMSVFGIPWFLGSCYGFLICAPGYVLGSFCILVHRALRAWLRWCSIVLISPLSFSHLTRPPQPPSNTPAGSLSIVAVRDVVHAGVAATVWVAEVDPGDDWARQLIADSSIFTLLRWGLITYWVCGNVSFCVGSFPF